MVDFPLNAGTSPHRLLVGKWNLRLNSICLFKIGGVAALAPHDAHKVTQ